MKHFKTFVFLLPLSLLFAATGCSDEEMRTGPDGTQEGELHEVEVTFNIEARSNLQTRSKKSIARTGSRELKDCVFIPDGTLISQEEPPRQLISSNNWQQVNDVRIYVFKKNDAGNFVYYKPENKEEEEQDYFFVDAFSKKFDICKYAVWWGGTQKMAEEHSYTIKPLLPNGEYRFLAVARDDVNVGKKALLDPNDPLGEDSIIWKPGGTILEEATLQQHSDSASATELLSGCTSTPISVNEPGGFHQEIELKRAVAGLLMYVENVPAELEAWQTIGTMECDSCRKIDAIGIANGRGCSNRVLLHNGSALELNIPHGDRLLKYFMMLDFDGLNYKTKDGYYVETSNNEDHSNSMFLGAFIMPQLSNERGDDEDDKHHKHLYKSLYLVFYHFESKEAGYLPVQWWPIKIKPSTSSREEPNPSYFPIEANHFYSLGEREFSDDGTKLVIDKPIDLSLKGTTKSSNNLVITVDPDCDWNEDLEWAD